MVTRLLSRILRPVACQKSASISAVFCGMFFAVIWWNCELAIVDPRYPISFVPKTDLPSLRETDYEGWLRSKGLKSRQFTEEEVSYGEDGYGVNLDGGTLETEAAFLKKEVPVLCIILSKGRNKAKSVKDTWTTHCNHVIFYGPYADNTIPVLKYPASESSHTSFCRIALQVYHKYAGKFKWALIAEDSSYVLVENARHYVAPLDHMQPYYLGRTEQKYSTPPYNSPGSTILISAKSFDLLKETYGSNHNCQDESLNNGSLLMSRKFEVSLGIIFSLNPDNKSEVDSQPRDTRDSNGRARFLAFHPETHLIAGMLSMFNSFWRTNTFPINEGENCCSDKAISFHGLSPTQMYLTEYLMYHLSPFKNSPKGLGNKKPKYSRKSMSHGLIGRGIEVGTPMIKMIDEKRLTESKVKTSGSFNNLLNDVFSG